MKQFSNEITSKINAEIEISCIDSDISSEKALHMINFIRPLFEDLREFTHQYTFLDNNEEISFFKETKPFILSKLIYFNDIYLLELRKPNGSKEVLKEYYKKKQMAITEFCNANLDFYQYYRSKSTHLLRENGFPKDKSRTFMLSNLQNAMGIHLLDYIGYYPNELNAIYDKSNTAMRDSVSLLISLKQQLSKTKELNKEDLYIDFEKKGFEHDSIHFSDCFNQDKIVCLFFANGDSISFWEKMKELKKTYDNVCFVGYSNKYFLDADFINQLNSDYDACLFDDRGRYENTVMYAYRMDYRIAINYFLIFSSDGKLFDKYIN